MVAIKDNQLVLEHLFGTNGDTCNGKSVVAGQNATAATNTTTDIEESCTGG